MERLDVARRGFDRVALRRAEPCAGFVDLCVADLERFEPHAVELRRQVEEGGVAFAAHALDDRSDARGDARVLRERGARKQLALLLAGRAVPDRYTHGYDNIFSTGKTSIELAPAFLSCSSVSQKTF